jgi:hypothetical protein
MGLTADWKNPFAVATQALCRNSRRILRSGEVRRCIQGISFYDLSFQISGVRPARYLYKLASETSSIGDGPENIESDTMRGRLPVTAFQDSSC